MCGICGVVGISERAVVEKMTRTLSHRGPDGEGVEMFARHELGLGHRRLSIIDLSLLGRQPMANEDESVWITFNGEIYNYLELKKQLDLPSHQIRSESDTEIILHLYEERGVAAFGMLNGMFALALYDAKNARLFLVRDHLGVKPLYYTQAGGKFIFGSEIKAILASGYYSPAIDEQSVSDFFSFLYVPSPQTIYQGVYQLPPAHWLEFDLEARRIVKVQPFWQALDVEHTEKIVNPEQLEKEVRSLFTDAVHKQMVSDVPLGAFLSGGVDSNLIVGVMAQASRKPVKTFTVLFEGAGLDYYDERVEARRVAERFGTEHYELPIDLSHPEKMLDMVQHFDQPFGNTTFFLTYLLSQYTREHVTVALSGVGGDELFGGYPRYKAVQAAHWLKFIPSPLAKAGLKALSFASDSFADRRLHRWRALLDGLDKDEARQYLQWVYYLNEERKRRLLQPRATATLPSHRVLRRHLDDYPKKLEDGNRFSLLDTETFLPDNLLEYSDKMSMAWGLELRVPYLDHRLVEWAFRIPFSLKLNAQGSKQILRRAFADLIPPENQKIAKKGFNVPLGNWMRTKLDSYFDELLPRDYVEREGIFHYDAITRMREEHRRGKRDNSYELFSILMFDVWYRRYITNNW